jgi:colanic acid/amylovoran biosynthesis glycosyltransferase
LGKTIKIAIYTGVVPSSTFIERLIHGLAKKGLQIYLFGVQRRKPTLYNNVFHFTITKKRVSRLLQFIKYSLLLSFSCYKDKKKLDVIISAQNKNARQLKIKYYPVLYHRPDIFHLQWAKSIEDWLWVQNFGIKLVLSLRGTHVTISPIGDKQWNRIYSEHFPRVDGFHAVSDSMIPIAQKFGVNPEKIKVVKSGLDIEKLTFTRKPETGKELSIVSIGRSHWVKGFSYALDAMNLLEKDNIDFNYTIVGVDKDEELLYKRSQFGLEDKVTFKAIVPFTEVLALIRDADVLLLSSVEEGIANVVLEAMALGTLVVSNDCGGMSEVITDNKNGFLVPLRNSEALANALRNVSEINLESYNNITQAARNTIESQHNYENMIVEMKDLYHTVLKD